MHKSSCRPTSSVKALKGFMPFAQENKKAKPTEAKFRFFKHPDRVVFSADGRRAGVETESKRGENATPA